MAGGIVLDNKTRVLEEGSLGTFGGQASPIAGFPSSPAGDFRENHFEKNRKLEPKESGEKAEPAGLYSPMLAGEMANQGAWVHGQKASEFDMTNQVINTFQTQMIQAIAIERANIEQYQKYANTIATFFYAFANNHLGLNEASKKKVNPTATKAEPNSQGFTGSMPVVDRENVLEHLNRRTPGVGTNFGIQSTGHIETTGVPVLDQMKRMNLDGLVDLLGKGAFDAFAGWKMWFDQGILNAERGLAEQGAVIQATASQQQLMASIGSSVQRLEQSRMQSLGQIFSAAGQFLAAETKWHKIADLNMTFGGLLGVDGLNFSPFNPGFLNEDIRGASYVGRGDTYDKKGDVLVNARQLFYNFYGEDGIATKQIAAMRNSLISGAVDANQQFKRGVPNSMLSGLFGGSDWDGHQNGDPLMDRELMRQRIENFSQTPQQRMDTIISTLRDTDIEPGAHIVEFIGDLIK